MKETITPTAAQTKHLDSCLSEESTSDQSVFRAVLIRIQQHLLLRKADDPAVPPRVPSGYLGATRQMAKSKSSRWHLVNIVLCLILVGPSLAAPFMLSVTAWAAPAHLAHQESVATHLISQRPYCPVGVPGSVCSLADGINAFINIIKALFQIITAFFNNDPVGWIECILTAGTVACPTLSNVAPWAFDCPVDMAAFENTAKDSPGVSLASSEANQAVTTAQTTPNSSSSILIGGPAGGTVGDGPIPTGKKLTIYQTALAQANTDSQKDWLSGDGEPDGTVSFVKTTIDNTPLTTQVEHPSTYPSGHLLYTYVADTLQRDGMSTLTSISLGLGIAMIGPLFALAGFQLLLASMRPGSEKAMANAMDTLGRVLLAAAVVGLSYYVIQTLIDLTNRVNSAVVALHVTMGYPQTTIDGVGAVSYSIAGDTPQSFRGIVMPMDLWGCVLDDFLGIMASRVANMIGSSIPIFGGIFGITGRIREIGELINDIGEFLLLIMSVTIWGQAVARIVLLNYYIIMAPVAFACWGLPGYLGNQAIRAWFKGFLQLLFVQTLQLFILTTFPTLLPDFGQMHFPQGGSITQPVIQAFLVQLPPVITAAAATAAPKVMMGMGPMNTVAKAGALAGKAVAAAGMAVHGLVKKK